MKRHDGFRRGRATFPCRLCGRQTRDSSTTGGTELCSQCFDISGLDNTVNDNGLDPATYRAEADSLLAEIAAKGGNVARVKAANTFLFPKA